MAAKKVNDAVPTIAKEIGRVDRELIGDILNPIIELKKTVTGGAVNEKTWQKEMKVETAPARCLGSTSGLAGCLTILMPNPGCVHVAFSNHVANTAGTWPTS